MTLFGEFMYKILTAIVLFVSFGCSDKDIEGDEPGECTDKADNDADGKFDCDDSDCKGSPDCKEAKSRKSSRSTSSKKYSTKNTRTGLSFSCDESTVYQMSQRQRVLARNEPFARKGREFKTAWIRCHFLAQSWYEPSEYYSDNDLNSKDHKCIKLVKKIEKEMGKYNYKRNEDDYCNLDAGR
jgi:hypothetical protein